MDDATTRDLTPSPEDGAADAAARDASATNAATADPQAELEALRRELDERHDRMLRALAEADNARRRAQRERDEYVKYATESLIRDLVPVLDNFDRALEAARASGEAASVVAGVELIQRELLRVLERAGVTRYSAVGERFDPTRHEAVGRVVAADTAPDTVVREAAPGYLLNDRVLRAALVTVAVAPDEDAA
jgi:molecular chaperone GrpE